MLKSFFVLVFLFFSVSALSQLEEVRRVTQTLCSEAFHGRGYVNRGDSLAAAFILNEFKQIGLKPLKKKYSQSFNLSVNTFPAHLSVTQNQQVLLPGIHYLVDPASGGGKKQLIPKIISLQTATNREQLIKEITTILKGKQYNSVALNFAKAPTDSLKLVAGLAEELAKLLPVIEITDKKFNWSVATEQLKFPLIQLQDSIFDKSATFSIDIDAKFIENYTSQNIFGYLPARKKTEKTIVYSAHYDHLGQMGSETYFPGGNDNASGTAMLISMARYFKEHPIDDYNILFIAFAGEEAGLIGSKYFVEHPLIKLKNIEFLINLDIMGSGEEGITVVNATLFEKEFSALKAINDEKQLLAKVKSRGPAANSDHYWFTQAGVPAFFIYTMGPNKNYHDVFDTYDNLSFIEYSDITTLLVEFTKHFQKQ